VGAAANTRAWTLPGSLLVLAVGVGVLAGIDPTLGVAAAMGVGFVTIVMADLSIGLCIYALLAFLNIVPDAGPSFLSFDKVAGGLLALSWLATVASRKTARRAFVAAHPQFFAILVFFLAWVILSLTWADHPGEGVESASRYILNAFLFLIVFSAVRTRKHVIWLLSAFVLSSALSAAYGLIAPPVPGNEGRLSGTIGEPNQLAAVLVAGLVLAGALAIVMKGKPLARIGLCVAAVLCLVCTFLTLSRAGLIALAVAMAALVAVAGRWRAPAAVAAALTVLSLVGFFAVIATPEQTGRVTEVAGGSGRADIWTIGWRMVQAHPVKGIGVGQFRSSAVHYLIAPGTIQRSDLIITTPKVAHNIYLHVLAEMGVIGLVAFVLILGFSLRCALRAARLFERRRDFTMELLSRAVFVGLVGILTADFFASEQFSKQLWLLLGLGPALLTMAQGGAYEEEDTDAGSPPAGPLAPERLEPAPVVPAPRAVTA
jgi:O-antigen ligase